MSKQRELHKLMKRYEKLGWDIEHTKNGHYRWFPPGFRPGERFITTCGTPGKDSTILTIKSHLRSIKNAPQAEW
jgi:hypothetical protein